MRANAVDLTAILRAWREKSPSTTVIKTTGIGRTIRRLAQSSSVDPGVRAEAAAVYQHWRAQVEKRVELETRGPLEVECDRPTANWRQRARHLLNQAVTTAGQPEQDLALNLEKAAFELCRHVIGNRYRRCVRSMVLSLRNAPSPVPLENRAAHREFVRTHLQD
ncbi:transcription elongation factor A N-terminal and central domain-containing protein 2-like [Tigriopus californicus]|uniref:transcription elongation factor A N-terminal and central domain-containing protein 2-like n=1 Tax=Tigriopus californicus TaxID=6832 RepID=UPI0027DA5E78|nr:transcription elongation factor A N-terminal and central domain-containing protein 2-like [Tigriopus californicus]